jgi:predicted component of type VI protein secretion system
MTIELSGIEILIAGLLSFVPPIVCVFAAIWMRRAASELTELLAERHDIDHQAAINRQEAESEAMTDQAVKDAIL